jgi:hypothetical protein
LPLERFYIPDELGIGGKVMSFARKMRRKGLNKTSCCGKQMWHKAWGDEEYDLYVCGRCGKEKRIKKEV